MLETEMTEIARYPVPIERVSSIPGVQVRYKKNADLYHILVNRNQVSETQLAEITAALEATDLSFEILQ